MLGTFLVAAPLGSSFCSSRRRVAMAEVEIVARVERRRKWSEAEKTALLAEVEAEGGKVSVVARRHRIAESLLYSWRTARKAAAAAGGDAAPLAFVPIGVDRPQHLPPPLVRRKHLKVLRFCDFREVSTSVQG